MLDGTTSSPTTPTIPKPRSTAPIIVERQGKSSFRVHAIDEQDDNEKFRLILQGMTAGCRFWVKSGYAASAIPDVLRTIAESIKGRGYSVILRT